MNPSVGIIKISNFSAEHFPLTDGRITKEMLEKKVIHPQTGKEDYLYDISADFSGSPEKTPITKEQWEKMKKAERKDHAWAPSFSATAFLEIQVRRLLIWLCVSKSWKA